MTDNLADDAEEVDADRPLEELGLSSRDAVALAGDLEELLDRVLPATLAWETPTIRMLARRLVAVDSGEDAAGPEVEAAAAKPAEKETDADADLIAVVGVGCRLPGEISGPDAYWDFLLAGGDGITEVPAGRWDSFVAPSPATDSLLERTTRWGGFLSDVTGFDADFFGVSPREAEVMDPQQRLLLEVAWEALEHAGIPADTLRGTQTGVFVGISVSEYSHLTTADLNRIDAWTSTGSALSIAANRLSYLLDLRGPSMAMDTACSSSLVALHTACASLRSGESRTALVGGVNLLLAPTITVNFDLAGALAADGRCKTFSAAADGIARGEGCGVIVLKRLADARRDGDRILAVVRGSAVNSDGRSNGMMAPNPQAQEALLRTAYARAGIAPSEVDYIEAHGTGTLLGDPIEAGALGAVLGRDRADSRPLLLGSVKTNIGHLEAAAGIAGVIKVVLALAHDRIPASLHFDEPNPHIAFGRAHLEVAATDRAWPRYSGRARAGVSGFGFGGTNAHVILEEWPAPSLIPSARQPSPGDEPAVEAGVQEPGVDILTLSGQTDSRIAGTARALADWMAGGPGRDAAPADVAYTLARHRGHRQVRTAVAGRGREDLVAGLRRIADGLEAPTIVTGRSDKIGRGTVWVFSGYGSQWAGMGRRLLADEPAFAAAVDQIEPLIRRESGISLRGTLERGEKLTGVADTQMVLFGMQVALAALWRSYGVEPAAVIGHSMGEVAAAVVAGALDVADAVQVMAVRSTLLAGIDDAGAGAMAVVDLSAAEFDDLADQFPGVGVAVYGSPSQCTVAGDGDQVRRLVGHVEGLGRDAWLLAVTGAGHSPAVDPVLAELTESLAGVRGRRPSVPFYTTVLDDPREAATFDSGYWAANARRPVRFTQAVAAAAADGFTSYLEISPHPVASFALKRTLDVAGVSGVVTPTLRRDTDDGVTFARNLASLHVNGHPDALAKRYARGRFTDLPVTTWQHSRFWLDAKPVAAAPPSHDHPLAGVHIEVPGSAQHVWKSDVGTALLPWLADHQVYGVTVLPGAAYAEIALAAATEAFGVDVAAVELTGLELHQILAVGEHTAVTTTLTTTGPGAATVDVFAQGTGTTRPGATAPKEWVRHATAHLTVAPVAGTRPDANPALVNPVPVDLYAAFLSAGHRYGPAFVGVTDAYAGDAGTATARVALPATATPHPLYHLHPALLDLCLQTLGVAATTLWASEPDPGRSGSEGTALYLPVGIGSLRVLGDTSGGGHVDATLSPLDTGRAGLSGTVRLIGDDGELLMEARDVYLRRLDRIAVPVPLDEKLFEARFTPAELDAATTGAPPSSWLLLSGDGVEDGAASADGLAAGLEAAGHRIVRGSYRDVTGVAAALAELRADPDRPAAGVVLVATGRGPSGSGDTTDTEYDGLEADLAADEDLVMAAARTARTIVDAGYPTSRLWIVTRGGTSVLPGEAGRPGSAALRGLVRVLAFEHPDLAATLVDLDGHAPGSGQDALLAEVLAAPADDEVAWRSGTRYAARLARAALPDSVPAYPDLADGGSPAAPVVRPGAYIVTGGLGGLGLLLAAWLTERGASRIVLSGRRGATAETEKILADLRDKGTDVRVVAGDLAEPGVADRLVTVATEDGMRLHGVVHAAGVLEDQIVAGMDADSLHRVWAPKVTGGWRLHAATAGTDLDWWVVFSSAAALLGSPGQAAYATANAWLDALVDWRRARGLPAATINWGTWSEVGGARDNTAVLLEPLSPAEGIEALEAVLASDRAHTGVTRLNPTRALALLPGLRDLAFFAPLLADVTAGDAGGDTAGDQGADWPGVAALKAADPETGWTILSDRLRSRIGGIMGFRPDQLDVTVPLTELGLDSLMAVRAKNAVESDFGLPLPVRMLLQGASLLDFERHLAGELGLDIAAAGARAVAPPPIVPPGAAPGYLPPRDPTERWLVGLWEDVLGRSPVGVKEDFHETGGDANRERELAAKVTERLGADAADGLFTASTVEGMADLLRERLEGNAGSPLRTLRASGGRPPLFLFHPAGGPTSVYEPLVGLLDADQPVYGFERIDDLRHVENKAARYIQMIREIQPHGPYRLGGWSFGGILANEAAHQLVQAGETVDVVAMIDTILPLPAPDVPHRELIIERYGRFADYIGETYGTSLNLPYDELARLDEDRQIELLMTLLANAGLGMPSGVMEHQRTSYVDARIAERYQPVRYDGRVVLYRAAESEAVAVTIDPRYMRTDETLGWDATCPNLEVVRVPGNHTSLIDRPNVEIIAAHLGALLDELTVQRA